MGKISNLPNYYSWFMQVSIFTPLQGGGYFIKIGQSVITPNDIPNKRYEPALLFRIETPVFQRTIHKKVGLRRIRFLNLQRIIWVGIAFNIMLEQGLLSFCLVCGFFFFLLLGFLGDWWTDFQYQNEHILWGENNLLRLTKYAIHFTL